MTLTQTVCPNRITLHTGKQRAHSAETGALAQVFKKSTTEHILLAYGLPKETVTAIMMLYKNTKVKVCLLDGDRLFDIVAGILEEGYNSSI